MSAPRWRRASGYTSMRSKRAQGLEGKGKGLPESHKRWGGGGPRRKPGRGDLRGREWSRLWLSTCPPSEAMRTRRCFGRGQVAHGHEVSDFRPRPQVSTPSAQRGTSAGETLHASSGATARTKPRRGRGTGAPVPDNPLPESRGHRPGARPRQGPPRTVRATQRFEHLIFAHATPARTSRHNRSHGVIHNIAMSI